MRVVPDHSLHCLVTKIQFKINLQVKLILILLISFVQKMSSIYIYNFCIYSNALLANFIMEENTMNPEQKV